MRTFEDRPAVRERVPLLIGLFGPSGSGKTYSALRLATGMQRVFPGPIFAVDTENGRTLHYASEFSFQHVPFDPPFGPLDYKAAVEHCLARHASVIIIDSGSHEHEGEGGVLQMHDDEAQRLAKAWSTSLDKVKMAAWQRPKKDRQKFINAIVRPRTCIIVCFRAKEKLKIATGQNPIPLGWQPIAAPELVFEMTVNCLLLPGANGVPTWQPDEKGEQQMVKLPGWAREMFRKGAALDEATGEKLARWAAGEPARSLDELLRDFAKASDAAAVKALRAEARVLWGGLSKDDREQLTAEMELATKRVKGAGDAAA